MPDLDHRAMKDHPGGTRRSGVPRTSGLPPHAQQQQKIFRQIDVSEILTEEQIQCEKRREAAAIEAGVAEIKEATDEFAALLEHQQVGLDGLATNVNAAAQSVGAGREQLETASRRQSCCRGTLCLMLLILGGVVAAVALVVFIVKR
ncbi:hypothetical protein DQ04_00031110 [Trypanosoma grayi]|uniref:hypothetical protein n=1 Tax=Trypanosoma grayi TaxID=71804 RepID=UPI0004F47FCA|nr:hypothetical protein DQ04_00031110 [Trypanosoma grayi]KEG15577.1 hypothetical protein DQ04_00031110 [Trypanosoma grayi]